MYKRQKLGVAEKYDIKVNLCGGGFTGQSQALRLAIARALVKINAEDKACLLYTSVGAVVGRDHLSAVAGYNGCRAGTQPVDLRRRH